MAIVGNVTAPGETTADPETISHDNNGDYLQVRVSPINVSRTVASITYNGVNLTEVISENTNTGGIYLWELENPASGVNDVVITLAGTGGSRHISAVLSYVNVAAVGSSDEVTATGAVVTDTGSVNVTNVGADDLAELGVHWSATDPGTITPDSPATENYAVRANQADAAGSTNDTDTGTVDMGYTWGTGTDFDAIGIRVINAADTAPPLFVRWHVRRQSTIRRAA